MEMPKWSWILEISGQNFTFAVGQDIGRYLIGFWIKEGKCVVKVAKNYIRWDIYKS